MRQRDVEMVRERRRETMRLRDNVSEEEEKKKKVKGTCVCHQSEGVVWSQSKEIML